MNARRLFCLAVALVLGALAFNSEIIQKKFFYPLFYEKDILCYSGRNNLDPALVAAIIHNESHFKPTAVSTRGAIGIMQIMPDTGEWIAREMGVAGFACKDLKEPDINIRLGCWYLNQLLYQFKSEVKAVAAYNAGRGTVEAWLQENKWDGVTVSMIPFEETRKYVARVLADKEKYQKLYPGTWQKGQ